MSYHCDFLPESQTIVVRWNDVLTAESFIDFLSVLVAHPDFRSNMNRLYDFRSATIELTTTGLRSIKSEIQDLDEAHGDRRVAFLVHRDLAYGMMRMFTAIAENLRAEMGVFRDEAEAKAWIGLPVELELPLDPTPHSSKPNAAA